ncbi:MAG: S8 family serine peptidase, partial [Anaerolineae bacterium]|nr:S8 family serine peptidase [Anaerolineae bacterium]
GPGTSEADLSKVDPAVLDQLALDGEAEFHAILAVQADLSGAATLPTKVAKTAYVFSLLRETARQTQQPLTRYLDQRGLDYRVYYIANMIEVTGDRSAVEWLAARPDVARISAPPNPQPEPVTRGGAQPDGGEAVEWNIARVGAPDVWAMGFHGEGMVVGSNDTGVSYTHPALVDKYRGNLGGGSFDHNYNWWGGAGSTVPSDGDGHGTHTVGTMVGDDGSANQIGMAPGAQWIACAGLGGADTVECFEFFLAPWDLNHANPDPAKAPDAINNSWYDPSGYDYRPIIQNLNAAGVAVIKSAGNQGPNCTTITNPGYVPEIIATGGFSQGDVVYTSSSRGPTSNYGETILKPEVAAPAVNVRSSVPGGGYGTKTGTSMAAPHSTGLVALIWSAAPCLRGDVPLTKQIMMETAEAKIDPQCPPFVDHPNDVWGWGILDAEAAVQQAIGYCGGLGGLQGAVTSAKAPLQDVAVRAQAAGGYSKTDYTDALGLYAMQILSDTYTVTATRYGYEPVVVPGVQVTTDMTTTLDIVMTALPTHTVSGYVRDSVSNDPLAAVLQFTDAPEPPVNTNPATGYYSIQVAEGTWHLQASALLHLADTQEVVVYSDVTQDFYLDPLPCILLVDDDNNAPDTLPYFTAALDAMGLDYDVFDTAGGSGPGQAGLLGYKMVFWFSGDTYGGTAGPNGADETDLAAYLDAGGRLFLSSQDYLYDMGLTTFGSTYLGIGSYTNDSGNAAAKVGVAGDPIGDGLGPFSLTYPSGFSDFGDIVTAGAGASQAFRSSSSVNLDVDKASGLWKTVFFGTDWVPIYNNNAANGVAVLQRIVDFFGGCGCEAVHDADFVWEPPDPAAGEPVRFDGTAAGDAPIGFAWDFGDGSSGTGATVTHTFTYAYDHTVTMTATNACGQDVVSHTLYLECLPVEILDVTVEVSGCIAALSAELGGTPHYSYTWDFSAFGVSTDESPIVDFGLSGTYPYTLTVANCGGACSDTVTGTVTVECCEEVYNPSFTWEPVTPLEDQEVTFTGVASGTPPITFTWDYGDGTFGAGQMVTHTYAAGGVYTVVMTATNCAGSTATDTHAIVVRSKTYIYLPIVVRSE